MKSVPFSEEQTATKQLRNSSCAAECAEHHRWMWRCILAALQVQSFFHAILVFSWWLWDILSDLVGSICACLLFCILILIPKAACVFLLGGRRTHSNQICSVGIYQTWHLASQCILPQCIGDSGQKRRWRKSSSKENLPSWWWIQNSMVVLCADQQRTNAVFQNNMLQGSFLWQLWSNSNHSNHFQGFPHKQASGMLT